MTDEGYLQPCDDCPIKAARPAVRRWAIAKPDGTLFAVNGQTMTWPTRATARDARIAGDRVVRVRVTVEVVNDSC